MVSKRPASFKSNFPTRRTVNEAGSEFSLQTKHAVNGENALFQADSAALEDAT